MELSRKVRDAIVQYKPIAVFVDGTGLGSGVVDILNDMRLPCIVYEVNFASSPDGGDDEKYANQESRNMGKNACLVKNRMHSSGCSRFGSFLSG